MTASFDPDNGKKKKLVFFSDARLRLNSEVNRHKILCERLDAAEDRDWFTSWLPIIITYCGGVIDNTLKQSELDEMYDILTKQLREMRYAFTGGE